MACRQKTYFVHLCLFSHILTNKCFLTYSCGKFYLLKTTLNIVPPPQNIVFFVNFALCFSVFFILGKNHLPLPWFFQLFFWRKSALSFCATSTVLGVFFLHLSILHKNDFFWNLCHFLGLFSKKSPQKSLFTLFILKIGRYCDILKPNVIS